MTLLLDFANVMKKMMTQIKDAQQHSVTRTGNIDLIKERALADIMQIYRQYFSTEDLYELHARLLTHVPQWQQVNAVLIS